MRGTQVTKLLVVLCSLAPILAQASAQLKSFSLNRGEVRIEVPDDWQDAELLFGIPLTLLGPKKGGARPVLNVTPTGQSGVEFDAKELAKNHGEYEQGRKKWLEKHKGKALAFFPYGTLKWDGITEAHVVGYRYKINGIEFVEKSYYVICDGKLFHLKSLLRAAHESTYASTVDGMVRSFTCK